MSTSITTSFVTQYSNDVHEVFQRRGAHLLNAVFHQPDVVGSTARFHKIGTGSATTKARHGTITPMNQSHNAPQCTLADFYAGDWVDKLDQAKTNFEIRQRYASGGAMALGRKIDSQITTELNTSTQTSTAFTLTSKATVQASALEWAETLWDNDVPNDGEVYAVTTMRAWAQLMTIDGFSSADYVGSDGLPFMTGPSVGIGKWKDWMGVKWAQHTGLPGKGTSTADMFMWHKSAIGYASAAAAGNIAGNGAVQADITWHGDRAAHWVNHFMSGEACLIDETGVIKVEFDDTASIVTT